MAFWEHAIVPEIAENIQKHAQTCIRITYFLKTKRLFQSSYSINRTQCMADHPFFHCQPKELKYSLQKEKKICWSTSISMIITILIHTQKLHKIGKNSHLRQCKSCWFRWGTLRKQISTVQTSWVQLTLAIWEAKNKPLKFHFLNFYSTIRQLPTSGRKKSLDDEP